MQNASASTGLSPILRATIAAHPPLSRAAQDDLARRLVAARHAATSAALDVAPRASRRLVMLSAAMASAGWTPEQVDAWEATHGAEAHDRAPITRRALLADLWVADPDQHALLALQAIALDHCDDVYTSPRASRAYAAAVVQSRREVLTTAAALRRLEDRMVRHNLGLAAQVASRRARGCSVPVEDLMQTASEGLLATVRRYDPERGYCLSTMATWWVRHYVGRHVADHGRTIRLPVHLHDFIRHLRRAEDALRDPVTLADPSDEAIAAHLGVPVEKVVLAREASHPAVSVESTIRENTFADRAPMTLADTLADENLPDPADAIEDARQRRLANAAIRRLPQRTRDCLTLRHTQEGDDATYRSIGAKVGVSRERVRQIIAEGVDAVRQQVGVSAMCQVSSATC